MNKFAPGMMMLFNRGGILAFVVRMGMRDKFAIA